MSSNRIKKAPKTCTQPKSTTKQSKRRSTLNLPRVFTVYGTTTPRQPCTTKLLWSAPCLHKQLSLPSQLSRRDSSCSISKGRCLELTSMGLWLRIVIGSSRIWCRPRSIVQLRELLRSMTPRILSLENRLSIKRFKYKKRDLKKHNRAIGKVKIYLIRNKKQWKSYNRWLEAPMIGLMIPSQLMEHQEVLRKTHLVLKERPVKLKEVKLQTKSGVNLVWRLTRCKSFSRRLDLKSQLPWTRTARQSLSQ